MNNPEQKPNRACQPLTVGIDASRANREVKTGVEWYAYKIIQELKEVVPPSVRVLLYSPDPLADGLGELPYSWESRVLNWPPRRLWTKLRLAWEMWRNPPDLLFVPAYGLPPVLPKAAALTMHDVGFRRYPHRYSKADRRMQEMTAASAAQRASLILTVSEFSRQEIVHFYPEAEGKIKITPLAAARRRFHPMEEMHIRPLMEHFRLVRPYFIYIGRLDDKKNIGGLLRGFKEYHERHAAEAGTRRLVLIGPQGHGYREAMAQLSGSSAADQVIEMGYVASRHVPALLAGAEALVFPSHYEGFGLPILEALACRVPVIASREASLPEVAGEAAEYVNDPDSPTELAEAMCRLAKSPERRQELIALGERQLEGFSWRKTAELTWTALEQAGQQGREC